MGKSRLTKGIIIRIYNAGTADKVVVLLDQKGQRFATLAKNIRKSTSKKAHAIEIGNFVKIKYVEGYSIPILSEVDLLQDHANWKNEVANVALMQMILEVDSLFALEDSEEDELFSITIEVLKKSHNKQKHDLQNKIFLTAIFLLKVLKLSGNFPDISNYVDGEDRIESDKIFSKTNRIGIFKTGSTTNKISDRIYKIERFILTNDISEIQKLSVNPTEAKSMLKLHANWIELSIEKELKSKKVVYSLINKK